MTATIGDRIMQLLRERGRQDRGEPYSQAELTNMLTGQTLALDGKFYNFITNTSTISRVLRDKQEPPVAIISAICDIFGTDAEWLLRGNVLEPQIVEQRFMTDEANAIGALVDEMDQDTRRFILINAQMIHKLNQERKARQQEIARLMQDYLELISINNQGEAKSILDKFNSINIFGNR